MPPPNPRHYHTLLFGLVLTSSFTLGQTIPSAPPPPVLSSYCGKKKKNLKCESDYIISLFRPLLWLSIEPRVKIKFLPNAVSLICTGSYPSFQVYHLPFPITYQSLTCTRFSNRPLPAWGLCANCPGCLERSCQTFCLTLFHSSF